MKMIKHIGRHGEKKVAIVFRTLPGEPHMCLVVYTQTLNQRLHDALIKTIESEYAQSVANLYDALNRTMYEPHMPLLHVLHREGLLKKVNTDQILVCPTPRSSVKLSDLNALLEEMDKGEEAVRKLADIDASAGLQTKAEIARRMSRNSDDLDTIDPPNFTNDATEPQSVAEFFAESATPGTIAPPPAAPAVMASDATVAALVATVAELTKQVAMITETLATTTGTVVATKPAKAAKATKAKATVAETAETAPEASTDGQEAPKPKRGRPAKAKPGQ